MQTEIFAEPQDDREKFLVLKNKLQGGGQIAVAGSTKVTRLSEPWSTTRHQSGRVTVS